MLLELPLELLLEIKDHLDWPADAESLRLASKDLRASLKKDGDQPLTVLDALNARNTSMNMSTRLKWDRMCQEVDAESAGSPLKFCGRCRKAHPEDEFSEKQLQVGPWSRACRGRERMYRICKNLWCDIVDLGELEVNGKSFKCANFDFNHKSCRNCIGPEPAFTELRREASGYRRVSRLNMSGFFIFTFPPKITWLAAPRRNSISICRHTKLRPENWEEMKSDNASLGWGTGPSGLPRIVGQCNELHCGTQFSLDMGKCAGRIDISRGRHVYNASLKIEAFHKFPSLTHPEWLANTVPIKVKEISKPEFRKRFFETD